MKLNRESLSNKLIWKNYRLPTYDIEAVCAKTAKQPTWLHFGAGNIFRAFPAMLAQRLLTAGLADTGVIVCEGYDEELIDRVYREHDNLSVTVTLHGDGHTRREVVGSITESLKLSADYERVSEIFCAPTLQMVTFTITEKAYYLRDLQMQYRPEIQKDMKRAPHLAETMMGRIAALCIERARRCNAPLALVSLDNCDNNGDRLRRCIFDFIAEWRAHNLITDEEMTYVRTNITFPLTMIDKITPAPAEKIANALHMNDDLEQVIPFVTAKGTKASIFVNTESPQYLVIENAFPNGHPALEQLGIIFTRRSIVEKVAAMKACTCLNPLDTALGMYGCLLGYETIWEQMQDADIPSILVGISRESRRVDEDPGVIVPDEFLHEIMTVRYPNPHMPDSPKRIATDTSQKLGIRYGVTLKRYYNSSVPMHRVSRLEYIPLAIAGWLRYLMGVDDNGNAIELSPDPLMDSLQKRLADAGISFGVTDFGEYALESILSDAFIFGCNLYEIGAADAVTRIFRELNAGPGAVRTTLHKYAESLK